MTNSALSDFLRREGQARPGSEPTTALKDVVAWPPTSTLGARKRHCSSGSMEAMFLKGDLDGVMSDDPCGDPMHPRRGSHQRVAREGSD